MSCPFTYIGKVTLNYHLLNILYPHSAGVGRTGTYIALDMLIEESNKSSAGTGNIDVFSCVDHLRKQRVAMVQTHVRMICCRSQLPMYNMSEVTKSFLS